MSSRLVSSEKHIDNEGVKRRSFSRQEKRYFSLLATLKCHKAIESNAGPLVQGKIWVSYFRLFAAMGVSLGKRVDN